MTRKHFQRAAEFIKGIVQGDWSSELPSWAPTPIGTLIEVDTELKGNVSPYYVRAVWTAEAFILLFQEFNPRFNRETFLIACGLVQPAKPTRTRKAKS